jgi:glycosyltransferase involved in cell wall biosynthesis
MRIMIDGMNLALEQGTGVATYARNLAACIRLQGHHLSILYGKRVPDRADPLLREAMFVDNDPPPKQGLALAADAVTEFGRALPRVWRFARPQPVTETGHVLRESQRLSLPPADSYLNSRTLFRTAHLRFALTGRFLEVVLPEPVDIAHWTYPLPIRVRGARNVYTLHDLVPLKLPYTTLERKTRYWRLVTAIARDADHILTVSECSRRDIEAMLPASAGRVTNTYQSVDIPPSLLARDWADIDIELAHAFHAPMGEAVQGAPGTPDRLVRHGFYLFVGAVEPKKNLRRLIEAFLASGVREPLVVVGRKAWQFKEVVAMMMRSPRIIYLDYLPFAQMITLMRAARAVLFPSLYEGFGLPVLEAFRCGTPVITARASSTAEIAGDAALLVDPYDTADIRDAIRRLSGEGGEAIRHALVEAGHRQAARFDQATVAARIEACYRGLMAAPGGR